MTKKPSVAERILEFWPVLTVLFLGICSYAVDSYRLTQLEGSMDKRDKWNMKMEGELSDLRVQCARLGK